ncbi:MAG: GreA/GreB family elongation factor [Anaerolineae bacterium]
MDRVTLHSHVEVELISQNGARERLAFDLVPDRAADFAAGRLSETAPLARAILGKPAGATIPYKVGDLVQVRVLAVALPTATTDTDAAAAEREAKLDQARSQAELGNMISFALTFDSKWGDYDPEEIAAQWDEKEREGHEKGSGPA